MENRQLLAAFAWIGGGSTTNWTDGTNWNGGDAPVAGSDLIFSSKAVSRTAVNDFTPGTSFNSIAINDSGYNLSGNMIDLGSSLNDYASGASTLSVPITMTTSLDVEVASGGTLTMSGILDDGPQAYGLAVNQITSDDGTLSLTAANSYDGGTTFGVGTLAISNSNALGMGTFHSVPLGSSGGVLDLSGGIAVANAMSLTGALTPPAGVINNISDTNTLSGPITFNGTNTLSVTSGQLTLAGQIDQSIASSGLTKLGSGLLELDAANSCSGYVTIVTGTVLAANSTALGTGGVVIDSGTELQLRGGDHRRQSDHTVWHGSEQQRGLAQPVGHQHHLGPDDAACDLLNRRRRGRAR